MRMHKLIFTGLLPLMLAIAGCGGGGSSGFGGSGASSGGGGQSIVTSGPNVVTMTVDQGPVVGGKAIDSVDIPYITVTICNPNDTTQCQTFDHIEVDTGSYGFRILAGATDTSGNPYNLTLPIETVNGLPVAECTQFADGYSWGLVATANVQISSESANGVPVQVIGDSGVSSAFPAVPANCASVGTSEDTVSSFGANGILGVGPFASDCGSGCATSVSNGIYYGCPATGGCTEIEVPVANQVTNPVADFQADNNGVIIELPPIDAGGAVTATGSLVFGIGTEGNNTMTAGNVLTADDSGDFTTQFNGQSLPYSLLDTGSNAYYFEDSAIPNCTQTGLTGWFCPTSTVTLSATNYAVNASNQMAGTTSTVSISVANADTLFNTQSSSGTYYSAFDDVAGSSGDQTAICGSSNCSFDFGLPFFFGRNVFVALSGASTAAGDGPYYAY